MRSGSRLMLFLIIYPILLNRYIISIFRKTIVLKAYAAMENLPKGFFLPCKNNEAQQRIAHTEAKKKADNLIRVFFKVLHISIERNIYLYKLGGG